MIVYGSRAVHLKTVQSHKATCANCDTQGSIIISVFRKHAHIFWIPLFPIGKRGVSQCQHCKNTLESGSMPESIKREYTNLKEDAKGPYWQFSGLGLILAFFLYSSYSGGENKKITLDYISAPVKGDVYEYKMEEGDYSTLKVIAVTNDSVFVSPNEYAINRISKIYKIDKPENYSELSYGIGKDRLKEMYESGDVFDINR